MYVISIHSVSDPDAFWSAPLQLPEGTELPMVVPSADGTRGVCVFRSDSVDTVRDLVDGGSIDVTPGWTRFPVLSMESQTSFSRRAAASARKPGTPRISSSGWPFSAMPWLCSQP